MILKRLRLALALATLSAGLSPAFASDPYCLGIQCFPTIAVIDPATGKPVSPAGGGSSGGGAITAPIGSTTKAQSVSTTLATDQLLPAFAATPTFNIGTSPTLTIQGAVTQGAAGSAAWKVDGSAVTQPVSGTVTANQGGAPWSTAATEADGANVTLGSKADAANAATGSTAMAIFRQLHADLIAATPTGTNTIGKVGIDQSSPGVTNAVGPQGIYVSSPPILSNAQYFPLSIDQGANLRITEPGSSDPLVGIIPATATGTAKVGKASAGNLYSAFAMATAAPSGQEYLVCINATAAPSAGGAITPIDLAPIGQGTAAIGNSALINFGSGPPSAYSTGITCLVTTSLTTYTAGASAFINVRVR